MDCIKYANNPPITLLPLLLLIERHEFKAAGASGVGFNQSHSQAFLPVLSCLCH